MKKIFSALGKLDGFPLFILLLIGLGIPTVIVHTANARTSSPNKVLNVNVGDDGYYTIDTRFNLCFFISKSTVQIPCTPFKEIINKN